MKSSISLAGITILLAVTSLSAATHYVWPDSPSPGPPYDTWANAAHVIQMAVDAAAVGDEIVVTNGVYATGGRAVGTNVLVNRVAVDKPLTVRSVNGPQFTIIQGYQVPDTTNGDGAIRCVSLSDGASLSGLTLTNGATRTNGDISFEQSGGGVWCGSSTTLVTNCIAAGNSASWGGGAAYNGTLKNCALTGNSAYTEGGGGAYGGTLNHCSLNGNYAGGWGGGGASGSTLKHCTLSGNSAGYAGWGGGAFRSTLTNCTLTGNSASYAGGGSFDSTLSGCTVTGNSAEYGGGAYWGTLNGCTLSGNTADDGGGAMNSTLNNCTLAANSAGSWAGGARGCSLINCTVTGNYAGDWIMGNGVVVDCELVNCIVYFNRSFLGGYNYSGGSLNYCCTMPMPSDWQGVGNITNAPLFVNYTADDFRLRPDSPCIDAGTNLVGLLTTDILGLPRLMDGNGDGIARVDMGAYEFNPYRCEPTLHLSANGFQFTVWGEPGRSVRIERSRDLVNWEFAGQVPIPIGGQTLIDPAATTEPRLFYRAIRVP
jgi:hypothetical protein